MYRYAHKNVRPFSAVCQNNYGRQVIFTRKRQITKNNIIEELNKALVIHEQNAIEIEYLDRCTRCRKRKADPGHTTCTFCRETMRRARVKMPERTGRYEQGLCFFCDNPVKPGYKVCEMHYQQNVKNATCEKANIARQKIKERSPQWTP